MTKQAIIERLQQKVRDLNHVLKHEAMPPHGYYGGGGGHYDIRMADDRELFEETLRLLSVKS